MAIRQGVTIHEVARRARVSVATISRVLNDSDLVAEETRERVRRIAREMNYVPNATARGLSKRKTDVIGLLLPDIYGEFFSEIIRGADLQARTSGYHLLVSSAHSSASELMNAIRTMRGRVDGLVIMSPHLESGKILVDIASALPVVVLNSAFQGPVHKSITIDNYGGARQLVEHLLGIGCRRVAIIRGEPGNLDAEERFRGFSTGLAEAGVPLQADDIVTGDFTEESGYAAASTLIAMRELPSAVFASNDAMAIGALRAMRLAKIRVPEDVALAGFDDIAAAEYLHPALTSVHVDISRMGSLAIDEMVSAIRDGSTGSNDRQIVLPATLVVRESTVGSTHP